MATEENESMHSRRFFVERNIPIAVLVLVAIQLIAGLWWSAAFSSSMTEKMGGLSSAISELKAEKYTKDDARRDGELFRAIIDAQRQADREFDRRLTMVENSKGKQ